MSDEKPKGLYIDKEIHSALKQLAAKRGVSLRELAENLIKAELEEIKKSERNH